jgi:outer membrane immunogenic protein
MPASIGRKIAVHHKLVSCAQAPCQVALLQQKKLIFARNWKSLYNVVSIREYSDKSSFKTYIEEGAMRNRVLGLLAVSALGVGFVQASFAADLQKPTYKAPPPPVVLPYNWTGFYAGIHIGGARAREQWGDTSSDCIHLSPVDGRLPDPTTLPQVLCASDLRSHTDKGTLGGAQAGYNLQNGIWVFGIEGQFSFSNLKGNHGRTQIIPPQPPGLGQVEGIQQFATKVQDFGMIAARFGVVAGDRGNTLLFVKGGAAFADDRFTADYSATLGALGLANQSTSASLTHSGIRWGYVVGAGFEHMLDQNWSVKIEYDFLGLGKKNTTLAGTATADDHTCFQCVGHYVGTASRTIAIDQQIHLLMLGVNYHLGAQP